MSSKKGFHLSDEVIADIATIAGQAGAKAFYETMQRENQQERESCHDRRLRNTKLLLSNYRMFKAHAENAVYTVDEASEDAYDIIDLMSDRFSNGNMFVESIKQSVARTVTIVHHINAMLGLYEVYCGSTGNPEDARRWDIISGLYIEDPPKTVKQLAYEHSVTERTVYRDIDDACEKIAALIFGIDGIRKG